MEGNLKIGEKLRRKNGRKRGDTENNKVIINILFIIYKNMRSVLFKIQTVIWLYSYNLPTVNCQ